MKTMHMISKVSTDAFVALHVKQHFWHFWLYETQCCK